MLNQLRKPGSSSSHKGVINLSALSYDLLVNWLVMSGKEQAFRLWVTEVAGLGPGETVLDVGCGTGTLALVANGRVGSTGQVFGVDPSAQLLQGARHKAQRHGLEIDFRLGGIEQLPLADHSCDVVLSTFMMHHLPQDLKSQGLAEIVRVLKPGGRLLVVDFTTSPSPSSSQEQPTRVSGVGEGEHSLQSLLPLIQKAGIPQIESGAVPFHIRSLGGRRTGHQHYGFVLGRKLLEN
jgi:ubiquinone/menaquinone biosynthesis C-methylase UbiE